MCGIAGKVSAAPIDRRTVDTMTDALRHRGPDDGDVWVGDGAALGSRRLAIIDLSPRGRMPMTSEEATATTAVKAKIRQSSPRSRWMRSNPVLISGGIDWLNAMATPRKRSNTTRLSISAIQRRRRSRTISP